MNTSEESLATLERTGRRDTLQDQVLDLLRAHPDGLTKCEVEKCFRTAGESASKRLYDLRTNHRAHTSGVRKCVVSGKRASVWMAGEHRPSPSEIAAEADELERRARALLARSSELRRRSESANCERQTRLF